MPLTPPNIVTLIRLVLLPFYIQMLGTALFYPSTKHYLIALGWLAFMAFTDKLDGWLAHINNERWKSKWGAKWDPLADKAMFWSSMLVIMAWICYDDGNRMPAVLLIPVLAGHAFLDIESTRLRSVDGSGAKMLGKLKFCMDLLAIYLAITGAWALHRNPDVAPRPAWLVTGALALAVALATRNIHERRQVPALT